MDTRGVTHHEVRLPVSQHLRASGANGWTFFASAEGPQVFLDGETRDVKEACVVDGLVDGGHPMLEKASCNEEGFHDGVAENFSISSVSIGFGPFQGGAKFEKVGRGLALARQIGDLLAVDLLLEGVDTISDPRDHVGIDLDEHWG